MTAPLSVVDAFSSGPFTGNPARVCVLDAPAPAARMLRVAAELNLSETAFVNRDGAAWRVRQFAPVGDVELCEHATVAMAHALWEDGARTDPRELFRVGARRAASKVEGLGRISRATMTSIYKTPEKWTPHGFGKHVGFHHYRLLPSGEVTMELEAQEHHLNISGIVHGGVLLSMLDSVMGGAVITHLNEGEWTATESLTTNFLRPGHPGKLTGYGRVDRRGKLTAFVSGEIKDADGNVIAKATGVWALRKG